MFQFANKRALLLMILIIVLLIGGTVGFVFLRGEGKFFAQKTAGTEIKSVNSPDIFQIPAQASDSDGDGLTDEAERELKTDAFKVDTDGDGLFDREEIKIYQTDPLSSDSDGDGVKDGEEVKQGKNPKGEGELLDFRAAVEKLEIK